VVKGSDAHWQSVVDLANKGTGSRQAGADKVGAGFDAGVDVSVDAVEGYVVVIALFCALEELDKTQHGRDDAPVSRKRLDVFFCNGVGVQPKQKDKV